MTTSLAQQLQKLAAPQTTVTLADARSRASILFDPKTAATKDRRAIYEIGLTGLQELTDFNPAFKEFQLTLFDEATLTLERSVELPEVNKMLDAAIAKFLRLLSPYILLRPAHMAFEWLLRRFQIHEYNRGEVMALILPYHETNIFVQILQTMRLREADAEWFWLRPLQRPGVPLAKTALINRAASNPAFLSFVCRSTRKAVKELGPRAHQLQAQINFYATIVVGALQTAKPLEDWHISTILEALLQGLVSDTIDFMAASYVIVAQLVSRTKLKAKVCNALLERVANCPFERLQTESLLLLVCIYGKQQAAGPQLKPETVLNFIGQKWLIAALASLANGNFAIQSLCMPLMTGAVTAIREDDPSSGSYKQFLDNLLSDVPLPKPSAQQLINCFLDTFVSTESEPPAPSPIPMEEEDTIVIDSDDEMEAEKSSFQTWYAAYLEKLEKRYPEAFDLSVKEALRARSTTSNRQKALKLALGFRLNTSDEKAKRVYEKLYHYSPDWRLSAVQQLVQNLKTGKKRERSVKLLQECLPDRINDDSGAVVAAILSLPTEELLQMLEPVVFAQTLCRLLRRAQAQQKQKEWRALVPLSVQHLTTTAVSNHYDTNLVLLALMPLLFPSEPLAEHEHCALLMILKSEFCAKVPFLGQLKVSKKYPEFAVSKHRQHFLDVIAGSSRELFSQEQALLQSVEAHGGEAHMQDASQLTHLMLLLTAYAKRQLQPQESLHILERICQYSRGIQFRVNKSNRSDQNFVPLQLYIDFLLTLARNTKWAGLVATPWTQPTDGLRLCLRLMEILSAQVFTERCDAEERLEWTQALKRCLSIMLPAPQHKLEFLSNFCVFERLPELWANDSDYTVLRVQGFLLLEAVVANQDSKLECSLLHVLRVANACGSPLQTLRLQAMDTLQLMSQRELEPHVQQLVKALLKRRSELGMDHEQYALILYTILQPEHATPKEKLLLSKLRRSVLALASDPEQPPICTDFLLRALKHVNDESFLTALLPLGIAALEKIALEQGPNSQLKQLPWPYSEIYKSVMERYEGNIALNVLQRQPLAWDLFEASFAHHDAYIQLDQKLQPVPCVLLGILTPETYERLQSKHKVSLIRLIVEAATKADNDSIFLASHRLLKRCRLECQPLVQMLTEMCGKGVRAKTPTRRGSTATKQVDLTNASWKQGMTLLELLESKKQLIGSELLIPTLFELLQSCLTLEEHTAAEYPKQLILSSLLHCCQTAQAAGVQLAKALPESCFRIEQVVQCLRNTKNPQTQQHALLFLTHCAGLYPQQVLHKIVEIFTFVGSTVARHDDAFSLHIIHNVVESIIPILLLNTGQRDRLVIPVLKVFADICTDVPVHRRLSLYATLFRVLDPKAHLWQFLCILFESQVLLESLPHKVAVDKSRLDFARELTLMFQEPSVALETCIRLLEYLGQLPVDKSNQSGASGGGSSSLLSTEQQLFDVRTRSFKQLRHYKYVIMDYLSGISSSIEWQAKMKSANPGDLLPHYQALILQTLAFVDVISRALEAASGNSSLEKYWRVLSNHAQDVLDNAIGMLAPEYFLHVITDLLEHPLIQVRIKVLELLVTKLTPTCDYFAHSTTEHFGVLFAPLEAIINGILDSGSSNPQQAQLQQTALQALQLLAHRHGRDFLDECRSLLATLTKITKRRSNVPKAVVGNVVLTLGEICSSLKAHALAQLPKFAPQLTEFLKEQVHQMVTHKQGPDYVCSTLVTAFHKLFKALPLFLGPYLVDIISALVRLSVQLNSPLLAQEKRAQALRLRLQELWSVVAHGVEVRILVPSCTKTYSSLLELQAYDEVGQLMSQLLLQCVKHNTNAQLQPVQEALSEFFLQALEFRLQVRGRGLERSQVSQIEGGISEAFVTWILKLSESSFRPMYSKVHKWAKESSARETQLTYFLLTNRIAEALKSLFVLFANDFIGDSSQLLQQHNTLNPAFTAGDNAEDDEELLVAILGTLNHVFLHCTDEFINEHRFNTLMQPLVDQLENDLVLGSEPLQLALSNCIAQLAVATNDVMWKQLNSQVLLKTRTTTPEVRILAFNTCVSIARKLGESFAPLLPETVPFVAELLEDEHQRVEKNTRNGVQELEAILGEPIQKYL